MVTRSSRTAQRHILAVDELSLPDVASAELFMTPDRTAFLMLPHSLPGKWEQARELIDNTSHIHRPHMQTIPYQDMHGISLSSWHHGSSYQTVISGRPEIILRYIDMTENERERYLLECRRQNAAGNEILSIAALDAARPIDSVETLRTHHDFTPVGSIAAHRSADPRKLARLRKLIERGDSITLLSREHPAYIASFAHRHGLFSSKSIYLDAAELPATPTDTQLAELATAAGIGHCSATPLKEYFDDTRAMLSPNARSLLY